MLYFTLALRVLGDLPRHGNNPLVLERELFPQHFRPSILRFRDRVQVMISSFKMFVDSLRQLLPESIFGIGLDVLEEALLVEGFIISCLLRSSRLLSSSI